MTAPKSGTSRSLGSFVAAYRGHLSRAEAARRSGVPEERWAEIETGSGRALPDAEGPSLSPHTVAAMCAAVGADIATGLKLAGHDPRRYEYLLSYPPRMMRLRRPLSPCIAVYRAIVDAVDAPDRDPRPAIASLYREVAEENYRLAERISQAPPDGRVEYWEGYASALRAIADEQSQIAETETRPPP